MGQAASSAAVGAAVAGYDGEGRIHALVGRDRCVLLGLALQSRVRHPHLLHGVPWRVFFSEFVGGPEAVPETLGSVVEPVLSPELAKQSAMRLVLLRQLSQAALFAASHNLCVVGVVVRREDPSHLLAVCREKTSGEEKEEADSVGKWLTEPWMRDPASKHWESARQLESVISLLRTKYREMTGAKLRGELSRVSANLLREECVLKLLLREELFVQKACDDVWRRVLAGPDEVWPRIRGAIEQLESRSFCLSVLRRDALWSRVSNDYALAVLCDCDLFLVNAAAESLSRVKTLTGEAVGEAALRLANDAESTVRLSAQQMPRIADELMCLALLVAGVRDTDVRVAERALLNCVPVPAVSRQLLANLLLPAICPHLSSEITDHRLAALDAATAVLDAIADDKPALTLTGQRVEPVDPRLPPFVRRKLFARNGLQPIEDAAVVPKLNLAIGLPKAPEPAVVAPAVTPPAVAAKHDSANDLRKLSGKKVVLPLPQERSPRIVLPKVSPSSEDRKSPRDKEPEQKKSPREREQEKKKSPREREQEKKRTSRPVSPRKEEAAPADRRSRATSTPPVAAPSGTSGASGSLRGRAQTEAPAPVVPASPPSSRLRMSPRPKKKEEEEEASDED